MLVQRVVQRCNGGGGLVVVLLAGWAGFGQGPECRGSRVEGEAPGVRQAVSEGVEARGREQGRLDGNCGMVDESLGESGEMLDLVAERKSSPSC